jgi:hypothetical protein
VPLFLGHIISNWTEQTFVKSTTPIGDSIFLPTMVRYLLLACNGLAEILLERVEGEAYNTGWKMFAFSAPFTKPEISAVGS